MPSTRSTILSPGKLPHGLLAELLDGLPTSSPQLLLGPAVGEDAAVIDFSPATDRLLVAKSDPITFASEEIGYYAVNICVNDLAVTGATPRFYLPTVLLPAAEASEKLARNVFQQIGAACQQLDLVIAGGHSEITQAVTQPVVAGTLLGEVLRDQYVSSGGGRPGDVILLAGVVPVEGTSILAREKRSTLLADGWREEELDTAANYLYDPGISIMAPALAAVDAGGVTSMHDPTEGGIATGLLELAHASGAGLEIDLDAIQVPELSQRICEHFAVDPLGVIASGALLATVAPTCADAVLGRWREHGWQGAAIGRLTAEKKLTATRGGARVTFPTFATDEIAKIWA